MWCDMKNGKCHDTMSDPCRMDINNPRAFRIVSIGTMVIKCARRIIDLCLLSPLPNAPPGHRQTTRETLAPPFRRHHHGNKASRRGLPNGPQATMSRPSNPCCCVLKRPIGLSEGRVQWQAKATPPITAPRNPRATVQLSTQQNTVESSVLQSPRDVLRCLQVDVFAGEEVSVM